jgi:hypothetical protein
MYEYIYTYIYINIHNFFSGKKAWKATEDDSRTQSLEIFRKHKREGNMNLYHLISIFVRIKISLCIYTSIDV